MQRDIDFPHTFETVPALRWIRLERIGCWKELDMEFLPGLNIITGDNGLGKTTILRAIVRALHP